MNYANPDLLEEAKSRCTDCEYESTRDDLYWCSDVDCDITAVTQCQVQDGEEGHIG